MYNGVAAHTSAIIFVAREMDVKMCFSVNIPCQYFTRIQLIIGPSIQHTKQIHRRTDINLFLCQHVVTDRGLLCWLIRASVASWPACRSVVPGSSLPVPTKERILSKLTRAPSLTWVPPSSRKKRWPSIKWQLVYKNMVLAYHMSNPPQRVENIIYLTFQAYAIINTEQNRYCNFKSKTELNQYKID